MSLAKQAVTTAAALKIINKKDNEKVESSGPKSLKDAFLARPLLWIVVGGVVSYVGYKVIKKISSGITSGKGQQGEQRQDVNQMERQFKPTFPDSSYFGFADAIYAARHGNNVLGTDEDAIYRIFRKMENNLDVAKLIKAFGKRRLSFSFQEGDLFGFISDEMSESEIAPINKHFAARNITYRF